MASRLSNEHGTAGKVTSNCNFIYKQGTDKYNMNGNGKIIIKKKIATLEKLA